jgi:hypothetical protein
LQLMLRGYQQTSKRCNNNSRAFVYDLV